MYIKKIMSEHQIIINTSAERLMTDRSQCKNTQLQLMNNNVVHKIKILTFFNNNNLHIK